MIASMMLAGLPVRDQDVLGIARLLREAGFDVTAERLEDAWDTEVKVLALTIADREAILRALDDPPPPGGRRCARGASTAPEQEAHTLTQSPSVARSCRPSSAGSR